MGYLHKKNIGGINGLKDRLMLMLIGVREMLRNL